MYQPFGIGFSRNVMYQHYGARNVIYGFQNELDMMKSKCPEIAWRCEELDVERHDFEYLREWRVKGNEFRFDKIDKNELVIIADTKEHLIELVEGWDYDIDFEDFEPGECFPTVIVNKTGKRAFKGICLNDAKEMSNDYEISGKTSSQLIDECLNPVLE